MEKIFIAFMIITTLCNAQEADFQEKNNGIIDTVINTATDTIVVASGIIVFVGVGIITIPVRILQSDKKGE